MSGLSDSAILLDPLMSPYAKSLLVHAGWVRNPARLLVKDPNPAEDLVQETWVMALQRPPGGSNLKAWLAALVDANTENIVIKLEARVHVKVILADAFSVLDTDGEPMLINQYLGKGRRTSRRQMLHEGKSGVVVISEMATKVVLFLGGTEVERFDIDLTAGEVREIRR